MLFSKEELAHMLDLYRGQTDQIGVNVHAKIHHMIRVNEGDAQYVPELPAQKAAMQEVKEIGSRYIVIRDYMFVGQPDFGHFIILGAEVANHPRLGDKRTATSSLLFGGYAVRTSPVMCMEYGDGGKLFVKTQNSNYMLERPVPQDIAQWKDKFIAVFPELKPYIAGDSEEQ